MLLLPSLDSVESNLANVADTPTSPDSFSMTRGQVL